MISVRFYETGFTFNVLENTKMYFWSFNQIVIFSQYYSTVRTCTGYFRKVYRNLQVRVPHNIFRVKLYHKNKELDQIDLLLGSLECSLKNKICMHVDYTGCPNFPHRCSTVCVHCIPLRNIETGCCSSLMMGPK